MDHIGFRVVTGIMCAIAGGAADTAVTLTDRSAASGGAGSQTARYRLASDRSVYIVTNSGTTHAGDWLATYADPANYDAQVGVVDGGPLNGPGGWLNLGTDREWWVTDAAPDGESVAVIFIVEIRNALTTIVLDSATITLSAERT